MNEPVKSTNVPTSRTRLTMFILAAVFAALTAVGTFVQIPLPFTPIPINLALLSIYLAGGLLGPKYGSLSIVVYVMIGAIGAPVFSGFSGGVGVLAGPTGGYILGYILTAFFTGLIIGTSKNPPLYRIIVSLIVGTLACYLLGTLWFMISMHMDIVKSLSLCVVPFLPGDAIKIVAATALIKALRRVMPTNNRG